jgi:nitrate/nitrite transport system permease protein
VSFGSVPGPKAVWAQAGVLWGAYCVDRAKEAEFYQKEAERKKTFLAEHPGETWKQRKYSGAPTYIDQIFTSLKTVFAGFVIASLIAVPLGILCGLSQVFNNAMNPFIQLFKPVSPLAWLPIVMIMVSALYNPKEPMFEKSFISSAFTVALCSLWPALINTSLGVAQIDNDYLNVARVLKLGWWKKTTKIVIPSALPLIFTGLRLSLGVGWMVLIAAEMLAQNPGLGKFVWDMFQNGSSDTLAQIMVAVFTIGIIGFALDRVMMILQRAVSFDNTAIR